MEQHPVDIAVGKQIRRLRGVKKVTMDQLAKQIGVSYQQVHKYETGVNRIAASTLWDIAKALDVPVGNLFIGVKQ